MIPEAPDPTDNASGRPLNAPPTWTWQDVGRETWRVYESALARPERPCVGRFSKPRAGRSEPGSMSGRGQAPLPPPPGGKQMNQ